MKNTLEHDPPHHAFSDVGRPLDWAIDLSVVGALTALALGLFTSLSMSTIAVTAGFAALFGGGLGALLPHLFHWRVRRVPVLVLLLAGVGLGACWGGGAGLCAALVTDTPWMRCTALAATACAVQLGGLWLPALLGRSRGGSAWGWVVLACLASPLVGWLLMQHVMW